MKAFIKCTFRHLSISLVHLLLYSFKGPQQVSKVQIPFAKSHWLFHRIPYLFGGGGSAIVLFF